MCLVCMMPNYKLRHIQSMLSIFTFVEMEFLVAYGSAIKTWILSLPDPSNKNNSRVRTIRLWSDTSYSYSLNQVLI
jgi:hypothetical protein